MSETLPSNAKLTANFSLPEFAVSAAHPDLVVPVPAPFRENIRKLAVLVVQPIRDELQRPLRILSGYRSTTLNMAVGGSPTSQHVQGEAADWTTAHMRDAWLAAMRMVEENRLPGAGQLIYYPAQGFVHCSLPSRRYPRATCCVHWPEQGINGYVAIAPTAAAFNALVPANIDPQRARLA